MSMRVEFTADPKGMFPEQVSVGDIRWVPRVLAVRLIKEGFAVLRGPDFIRKYEVAALQQAEKAVIEAEPPLKSNPLGDVEPTPDEEVKATKGPKTPKRKKSGGKRDEKGRFKGKRREDDNLPAVSESSEAHGEDRPSLHEEPFGEFEL